MSPTEEARPDLAPAEKILEQMRKPYGTIGKDKLIPILQQVQQAYGYLPPPVLTWMSRETGIPTSRMHGVITFYAQFYTEAHGRHTVRCCQGTACHVKNGRRIAETISDELGVREGGTTDDMRFTFETVACLGTCFLAPVIMVDGDYYGQLTSNKIASILKKYE